MTAATNSLGLGNMLPERKPRLWPGVVAVALMWGLMYIPAWVAHGTEFFYACVMFGISLAQLLFLGWWLFFSRVPWKSRILVLIGCAVIGYVAHLLAHPSYKHLILFFVPPWVFTVWIVWLVVSGGMRWQVRQTGLFVAFIITWGLFTLVRADGVDGNFAADLSFRWKPSAEEKFLAKADAKKPAPVVAAKPLELQAGDWPGFRGANRDSRLTGVNVATNWKEKPPRELWRRAVGPGWSSFAVIGNHAFTQEQMDQDEAIVCYDADTGNKIWEHRDQTRFWEEMAGAGPRATPTFHDGKIYSLGANGVLNCLDAATGKQIWSRNIADNPDVDIPYWGFASSPLISSGLAMVYAGGGKKKDEGVVGLFAFKADTGEPAWTIGKGRGTYCSVHPARINGVDQFIMVTNKGLTSYYPATGDELWNYEWEMDENFNRAVQPTVINDADVLLSTGFGKGVRRVHIAQDSGKWTTSEVWSSKAISPYYNDVVVYNDHLYGLDTGFLTCVSLADGKRKWKVRGYDSGQVLLLADQGVLLVQCEKGDVALVAANPDNHQELGRIPALKGKTWNHPVIAHGKLFVRNGEEAACFELKPEGDNKKQDPVTP
jgi:outer membrane protein assembly factor BamB